MKRNALLEKHNQMSNYIIGISGKRGVGKSFAAKYIANTYGFQVRSFADKLKELSGILFPLNYDQLYGLEKENPFKDYMWNPREFMIKFGAFMRYWDKDYWLKILDIKTNSYNIVIDDVRYLNEYEHLKTYGAKLIRIERYAKYNPYTECLNDPSENELDTKEFDYKIEAFNNIEKEVLYRTLASMMDKFGYA